MKSIFYLSDTTKSFSKFIVFEASFSDSCDISKCYIIASSLNQASLLLYSELSDTYGEDYLDSHLLCIRFLTVLPCNDFINE